MITPPDDATPIDMIAHALTVALGARDHYTRVHCDRVVQLSTELGRHIGLTAGELDKLSLGARFHDLGKIGIPDTVLRKPDSFDAREWECMQQHVVIGEQIVLAINGGRASGIARTVRHHHEHFDGSGYPDRLQGGDIPLDARIISVVDSYDAMTARRPYQNPRRHLAVMDILNSESGRKHDPDLVHAFGAIIEKSTMRASDD
ncbi:HD-GYP domain-containing protein [Ferribacterium limneticum]|uniref:HD-GYP domain-containing protein n=1 Tax=Ferribacterium limneticum TaxID=76259 RepID=UPI001CFB5A66|nr:HD domain-containing phosphohydrolase [Ferribacterium limneticum]UCV29356.1 HD domain-containing protein [Ferribacterium limneticum]UCV33275.1 HD domain-containing protein [Ferribacterium limneticum]